MKKLLLLAVITLLFTSCSVGDDTNSNYTLLPVYQFDVPTAFKVDSVSVFKVRYKRDFDCQIFNGMYFNATGDAIKIAVKVAELQETTCFPDGESVYEVPLNFKPSKSGVYILDFWTGKGANGEDQFSNTQIIVP